MPINCLNHRNTFRCIVKKKILSILLQLLTNMLIIKFKRLTVCHCFVCRGYFFSHPDNNGIMISTF